MVQISILKSRFGIIKLCKYCFFFFLLWSPRNTVWTATLNPNINYNTISSQEYFIDVLSVQKRGNYMQNLWFCESGCFLQFERKRQPAGGKDLSYEILHFQSLLTTSWSFLLQVCINYRIEASFFKMQNYLIHIGHEEEVIIGHRFCLKVIHMVYPFFRGTCQY